MAGPRSCVLSQQGCVHIRTRQDILSLVTNQQYSTILAAQRGKDASRVTGARCVARSVSEPRWVTSSRPTIGDASRDKGPHRVRQPVVVGGRGSDTMGTRRHDSLLRIIRSLVELDSSEQTTRRTTWVKRKGLSSCRGKGATALPVTTRAYFSLIILSLECKFKCQQQKLI